jgi:hypothetical protein
MATTIEVMTAGTPAVVRGPGPKQFSATFDITEVTVTLTEATIAAARSSQCSITVPGVEFNDYCMVSYPADIVGLLLVAQVSAANTIKVTAFNTEGTDAITAMSGGLVAKILVLKPKFG